MSLLLYKANLPKNWKEATDCFINDAPTSIDKYGLYSKSEYEAEQSHVVPAI